jgi:8-oxo-dGTP pyrophosphatase MutT (NUDIX family)
VTVLEDTPEDWPVVSSSIEFRGGMIKVRSDKLADPDKPFVRDVVVHPGAVAIVALDDEERALVVSQYRHPAKARLVEFPAGLLDVADEDPLAAAQRELREEGHVEAERWRPLLVMRPSPGSSDEVVHFYLAEGIRSSSVPDGFDAVHEEAGMTRAWVPLADLVTAVMGGRISNGLTIAGSLAVWHLRHEN